MKKKISRPYLIFLTAAFLATVALSCVFLLTEIITATNGGAPVEVMDGRFSYPPQTVYDTLNLLGESGRAQYLTFHIIDYFYLLSYGSLMAACLFPLLSKKHKWAAIVFPALPAGFDLLENTLIRIASLNFPREIPSLASAVSVFTTLKWSLGLMWFGVFLLAAAVRIVKKVKRAKA